MAHALVTQVSLEGRRPEDAERMLTDRLIPAVKQLSGFQRGVWLRSEDGSTGLGIVVFDSEQDAQSARDSMDTMRPADAPPITSVATYLVTGLA